MTNNHQDERERAVARALAAVLGDTSELAINAQFAAAKQFLAMLDAAREFDKKETP